MLIAHRVLNRHTDEERDHKSHFLKVSFLNKEIELINLPPFLTRTVTLCWKQYR